MEFSNGSSAVERNNRVSHNFITMDLYKCNSEITLLFLNDAVNNVFH